MNNDNQNIENNSVNENTNLNIENNFPNENKPKNYNSIIIIILLVILLLVLVYFLFIKKDNIETNVNNNDNNNSSLNENTNSDNEEIVDNEEDENDEEETSDIVDDYVASDTDYIVRNIKKEYHLLTISSSGIKDILAIKYKDDLLVSFLGIINNKAYYTKNNVVYYYDIKSKAETKWIDLSRLLTNEYNYSTIDGGTVSGNKIYVIDNGENVYTLSTNATSFSDLKLLKSRDMRDYLNELDLSKYNIDDDSEGYCFLHYKNGLVYNSDLDKIIYNNSTMSMNEFKDEFKITTLSGSSSTLKVSSILNEIDWFNIRF